MLRTKGDLMAAFGHILEIVARYRHRQLLPNPYLDELGDLHWPAMVLAPSGREVLFDSEMLASVRDLADCLRMDHSGLDRFIGVGEWLKMVQACVADALDVSDPGADLDVTARQVLDDVEKSLALSKEGLGQFEFAFGCTLFEGVVPRPFRIGPVRFETRQGWLERKFAEGAISDTTRRRVLRAWEGQAPRKRMRSKESRQEETILGLSHDAPFICSVVTNGMTHEFGQRLARTTARLALTAIALMWQRTSDALGHMNLVDDRVVRILHDLTFRDGQLVSWGGRKSHMPGGQRLSADDWDKLQSDFADRFSEIGELLKSIVDTTTSPRRPNTTHALTRAFLWFHQGCREDEPVHAAANFASALDCLTLGGCKDDIKKLVKALTGLNDEQILWVRGSQTIGQAVDEIYDHARNALLHGRMPKKDKPGSEPFRDWSPGRNRAEALARHCLLACIDRAAEHPDDDDPASWLKS